MADSHVGAGQMGQNVAGEDFADQSDVFMIEDGTALLDGDAGALLSSVLQSEQGVVGDAGGFFGICHNAEDTALLRELVKFPGNIHCPLPFWFRPGAKHGPMLRTDFLIQIPFWEMPFLFSSFPVLRMYEEFPVRPGAVITAGPWLFFLYTGAPQVQSSLQTG